MAEDYSDLEALFSRILSDDNIDKNIALLLFRYKYESDIAHMNKVSELERKMELQKLESDKLLAAKEKEILEYQNKALDSEIKRQNICLTSLNHNVESLKEAYEKQQESIVTILSNTQKCKK